MPGLLDYTDDQLAGMSHADLYRLRNLFADKLAQNRIAPFEHRAFAREAVTENPLLSIPIALATPIYQGYKALPLGARSRSDPGWDQIGQGLLGIGEGIAGFFRR